MTPYLPDGVSKELYPFTGKTIALNSGLKMHYLDEGSGQPVVMIHGNPSWSFYYRKLALALRGGSRVIAPDHIGCGLSDKPGDESYDYTLKSRVDDLEFLLDSLGLKENITLVVHDWGGMIGMTYAVHHPERIKKLVILNTGAFFLPEGKAFPAALRLCRTPFGAILIRGLNAFARGAAWVGCKRKRMNGELRRAYAAPYNSWANRIATLRFVEDIPLSPGDKAYPVVEETQSRLETLRAVPMLICWGLKDFIFDRHFLEEWRRRFPDAKKHSFPDCGHYILEDAHEEVIPLIKSFIENA
ncbi:MAG: alpha/beta hydrolase [Elusimicrobia bacterium RIFOXYA2_FULL_58_8]|nr:MAG: alpha/beta hydrolase [Elusimicrobia bacterium RIFOXYA12_FULL_57_11]OGS13146.1 MAG: alpha/beta hydrolase [Elusimicrobia bacterium RIFOXYA2_FULL_58_8]